MAAWLEGTIVEKQQWCEDLFSLKISTSSPLQFSAGQFVNVALNIDDKRTNRPYSLVNSPQDSLLEIHFNAVKEGLLSPELAKLVAGDRIEVSERASGLLTLSEMPDVPNLWLLATGTGLGPFLSILKTAEPWQRFKKIILAYSVKTLESQAYQSDFEMLQSRYPEKFCFAPFITREEIKNTFHSRLTQSIESGALEKHVGLTLSADNNHIMLCGNSTMISEVTILLEGKGLRRHTRREPGNIAIEKYY